MKRWHTLLLLLLPLLLNACAGYQLGTTKPAHLAQITKLHVPTFANATLEPRLAVLLTNAVIKQLQMSGGYEIVSEDKADAKLVGTIADLDRSQFRSVRTNTLRTQELLTRLRVDYSIQDSAGQKLHKGRVVGESYIVLDPNFQTSERQALSETSERLAVSLANEITSGW
jgi:outer membrane lipopolysaccharide assembly protein LptE/RlpB